jgi:hypothetical protein
VWLRRSRYGLRQGRGSHSLGLTVPSYTPGYSSDITRIVLVLFKVLEVAISFFAGDAIRVGSAAGSIGKVMSRLLQVRIAATIVVCKVCARIICKLAQVNGTALAGAAGSNVVVPFILVLSILIE